MAQHKIALVSSFPPSDRQLNEYGYHMARELAKRHDVREVVVIGDQLDEGFCEPDHGAKIRVERCWKYNNWLAARHISKALSREDVDGVIFNLQMDSFGSGDIAAALGLSTPALARMAGIRTGVIAHNLIEGLDLENVYLSRSLIRQGLMQLGGWLSSISITRANYLSTPLEAYANLLKNRFPFSDISMVPHGAFERGDVELQDYGERPRRIVAMGRFGTYKRLETLITAFEKVQSYKSGLNLVIAGIDHPSAPGYLAGIQKRCSGNSGITFKGYIPDEAVPDFFANSRLSVFDCRTTFGSFGVLHQSASFGCVPVFPYMGDFVELHEQEGIQGYHFEPGDANSLAAAIGKAIDNISLSTKYAKLNWKAVNAYPMSTVMDHHLRKLLGDCHQEQHMAFLAAAE